MSMRTFPDEPLELPPHRDVDFTLHCYPGKANVVADALSRKSRECWLVWLLGSGRCSRLWDNSGCTTGVNLRVLWGV